MPPAKPLDPARITALRAQGLSWQRVAERLGCSREHLAAVRKRNGLPVNQADKSRPISARRTSRQREVEHLYGQPLAELIDQFWRSGSSKSQIADLLGVNPKTALIWRKQVGAILE